MAKVTAPLFSFAASGQLAKSLVYLKWKGIDDVRSFVIPANPRSTGQQTQRGYFTEAVDLWHSVALTADDKEAWNRAAGALARIMSGFNAFVSYFIFLLVGGIGSGNEDVPFNGGISDSGAGQVDMTIEEGGTADAVNFRWGYTPTALINTQAATETANVWNALNVAAATGATVYAQADIFLTGNPIGQSGIYRFGPVS